MAAELFLLPYRPALDANAIPIPGASLYFYATGTSTPQAVYADEALTVTLGYIVEADAAGAWPSIYLDKSKIYRVVMRDAEGAPVPGAEADPYIPGVVDALAPEILEAAAETSANAQIIRDYTIGMYYLTPEAGVDPDTGVSPGRTYDVRSGGRVRMYDNVGGSPVGPIVEWATAAYLASVDGASIGYSAGTSYPDNTVGKQLQALGNAGANIAYNNATTYPANTVGSELRKWSTVDQGTVAAGEQRFIQTYNTYTANAAGTSDVRNILFGIKLVGANGSAFLSAGSYQSEAWHTAGTLTFQYGIQGFNRLGRVGSVDSTGNVTTSRGVEWHIANEGSGTIGTAFTFYAQDVDLLDGTGTIGQVVGYKVGNMGHASRVTESAIGVDVANMTGGAPITASIRSEMTTGTGKWFLYGAGSAPSVHVGRLRLGDTASPDRTLSLYGSDVWCEFHNANRRWVTGLGGSSDYQVYDVTDATLRLRVAASDGSVQPGADNVQSLGISGMRWSTVFAATGTINTSDARLKVYRPSGLTAAEVSAAKRIVAAMGFFQWADAIEEKGDGARWHFGPRAQDVAAILIDEGLEDPQTVDLAPDVFVADPPSFKTAFLCFDTWDDEFEDEFADVAVPETVTLDDGSTVEQETFVREVVGQIKVRAAGNRFGLRVDQLTLFLIAAMEQRLLAVETV